ncbi:MAG: hypothetical protein M2R45_00253 [Verrucomicrobia subdivision 3 bacterium]|nr:hypothetical protein [Limisphaerales bacterium]MCS1412987.1 hypothetical protein [Limisphaerales bacterium]
MTYVSADAPCNAAFPRRADRTVSVNNTDESVKAAESRWGAKDITYKRYTNNSGHSVFQHNAKETHPLMETSSPAHCKHPRLVTQTLKQRHVRPVQSE